MVNNVDFTVFLRETSCGFEQTGRKLKIVIHRRVIKVLFNENKVF